MSGTPLPPRGCAPGELSASTRALEGRCALVTGSTAGIGLATARALAAQGADVVLNGFGEPDAIARLCRELSNGHAVRVTHHGADVSRPDAVAALVAAAHAHGSGRLDILVNNAGVSHVAPVEAFAPERWDALLAVHLGAAFHAIRGALPHMRKAGWGRIVNVASVLGLVAAPQQAAYVAAKHGLLGLTKVVALETANTRITCNAVCPGLVATARVLDQHRQQGEDSGQGIAAAKAAAMATRQPSGEYIAAADVAAAIAFLCGPHAGEVRGAAWTVDGGWSAR